MSSSATFFPSVVVLGLACAVAAAQDNRRNSQRPHSPDNLGSRATPTVEDARGKTAVRLAVSTPLGGEVLLLQGFRGQESISSLFEFELDLVARNEDAISFDGILGKDILITVALDGGATRHFSGICNRFSQGETDHHSTKYRAEVVPKLWLLTRRRASRIFQEMSVPQIIARVLEAVPGILYELQLVGTFHPRDFEVQYRETDFDFLSRLLEEEGIYYFFRHTSEGHTMVIANTPQGHPDIAAAVPFLGEREKVRGSIGIATWEKVQELRSGKYTLRDYAFELPTPEATVEALATIQESVQVGQTLHRLRFDLSDTLELYDFPGEYAQRFDGVDSSGGQRPGELLKIREEAQRTVDIRMQEEAAQSLVIRGTSTSASLVSGHKFTLTEHVNGDGPYVLTSVHHRATDSTAESRQSSYANSFTCIPAALPFRPARTTPRPVIPGTQTAIVVGPPGEEVFTDKYGRVKVQFHWDREGSGDQRSSGWVRVGALNAGSELGFVQIPRIGQEVVVSFLEGDPDQPIIVGSVYNAGHLPGLDRSSPPIDER